MGPIPETLPADIGRDFDGIWAFGLCIEGKMGGTGNAESRFASSDAFDGRIRMRHLESRSRHSTTTRFHVHAGALACVTTQRVGWRYRSCFATLEITDQSVI